MDEIPDARPARAQSRLSTGNQARAERLSNPFAPNQTWPTVYETVDRAWADPADFVPFYNGVRRQSMMGGIPPADSFTAARQLSQIVALSTDNG